MGTDLLDGAFPGSPAITGLGDVKPARMHPALAERRAYLHPHRWTSLGLSLIEAMQLGMPVIALAATEATRAVPPEAGAVSADVDELVRAARRLLEDPEEAVARGRVAREVALERHGLARFLADWDETLETALGRGPRRKRLGNQGIAPGPTARREGLR
jgi:glycosyltransferase involved in cell wall biosynthesis